MTASEFIPGLIAALVVGLIPLYAFCYLLYVIVGLPLRRQERARLFLDLVETGVAHGQSIEHTIKSVAQCRDPSIGVRFHLLAAHLESGWSLVPALAQVRSLLPPQFVAMLKVGEEIGDMRCVLRACRTLLRDATSHIQSAYNYFVVLAFVLIPVIPVLFWTMSVFVIPRFETIFSEILEGGSLPFGFKYAAALAQIQIVVALLFYLGAMFYIGGPRFLGWLGAGLSWPQFHLILYCVPWRRKRIQRDFAAMLAVLLDAEVPEERAVVLAAESTANAYFTRRTSQVVSDLRQGIKLTDALARLDSSGEFKWRLSNALHSGKNFFVALEGWLEALDARAFRQQQTFAQAVTTALVLYNGLMVGLFAVFVFRGFTMIINQGVLW